MKHVTVEKQAANRNGVKRAAFVALSFILEIIIWWLVMTLLTNYVTVINIAARIFGLLVVVGLYSQRKTSAIKTPWIMLIMAFPIFGLMLYVLIGLNVHTRKMKLLYEDLDNTLLPLLPENATAQAELKAKNPAAANMTAYLKRTARFPVYHDSSIRYFDDASDGLEAQLKALAAARHFIFMEYHAIENEESWKRIENVLVERAKAGVDVRVFYDDMGSIGFVNTDFAEALEKKGIRSFVFNPFKYGLNMFLNNRDHRKITVVDGRIGFTGGYNLANEYFNLTHPYGMWKDTGVEIIGPAVKSLTVMFLEMWNAVRPDDKDRYAEYLEPAAEPLPAELWWENGALEAQRRNPSACAFIAPYADQPMDDIHVGEDVYINMAAKANDYCWFMTPYLILSDELTNALIEAAMRGVDVRIITPGIPDKKTVYKITRSFYRDLVASGVRIYEWTPGFCHAKMSIADDTMATCGTINLDYRSLYHHFENGCFFAHCDAVTDMRADFELTMAESREVTAEYKKDHGFVLTLEQRVLRLFAGLL
ncbi:MAG: phospholipase D-like domain-containing protein [Lachnospiraceae bacterium]|nr:phospholipase D-like domain-containing protein [Lachnospiraceae bacterium]